MVEQGNHNPLVGGSNPSAATITYSLKFNGELADREIRHGRMRVLLSRLATRCFSLIAPSYLLGNATKRATKRVNDVRGTVYVWRENLGEGRGTILFFG